MQSWLQMSVQLNFSVMSGDVQLLYMSPETLLTNKEWRDVLESPIVQDSLVGLIVDEAHCVKKWYVYLEITIVFIMTTILINARCRGEDFRKEFHKIGEVRSILPQWVNVMALTATAARPTQKAIYQRLGMVSPRVVSEPPHKPNIKYINR